MDLRLTATGTANSTWGPSEVLFRTPTRTYNALQLPDLMQDIGMGSSVPSVQFLALEPDLHDFAPPMVDTFVTYGFDIGTPTYWEVCT